VMTGGLREGNGVLCAGASEWEMGLRYWPGRGLPRERGPWIAGCAWVGGERLVFAEHYTGTVYRLELGSGRVTAVPGALDRPRAIYSTGDGLAIVAEPERCRLTLLDEEARVSSRIELGGLRPWHAAPWGDDWLVVDAEVGGVFLVERTGSQWRLPVPFATHSLRSAIPLDAGSYLLLDRGAQLLCRLTLAGEVTWRFGHYCEPSGEPDHLTSAEHAVPHPHGGVVVCDTRNNRVLHVGDDAQVLRAWGGVERAGSALGCLWAPLAATVTPGGEIIVADSLSGRLVRLEGRRPERVLWGDPAVARCDFYHPRCQEPTERGFLVADSYHNRVVHVDVRGEELARFDSLLGQPLFWPRFATRLGSSTFVSDSRNGRVIQIPDGGAPKELRPHVAGKPIRLCDPHFLRRCPGGLVLSDTGANRALLLGDDGEVRRAWGGAHDRLPGQLFVPALDLHDLYLMENGEAWVVDTGNHRILRVGPGGALLQTIDALKRPDGSPDRPLYAPRSVEPLGEGRLLVCDAGNNRVLSISTEGRIERGYGGARGHAVGHLSDPRFARRFGNRVLISDYGNNRLLSVRLAAMEAPVSRGAGRGPASSASRRGFLDPASLRGRKSGGAGAHRNTETFKR
jgi:hypothetical protein